MPWRSPPLKILFFSFFSRGRSLFRRRLETRDSHVNVSSMYAALCVTYRHALNGTCRAHASSILTLCIPDGCLRQCSDLFSPSGPAQAKREVATETTFEAYLRKRVRRSPAMTEMEELTHCACTHRPHVHPRLRTVPGASLRQPSHRLEGDPRRPFRALLHQDRVFTRKRISAKSASAPCHP